MMLLYIIFTILNLVLGIRGYIRAFNEDKWSSILLIIYLICSLGLVGLKIQDIKINEREKWKRAANFRYDGSFVNACLGDDYLCHKMMSTLEKNGSQVKCDDENYKIWYEAIEYDSTYPFPYYYLAKCYKNSNNPDWKKNAQIAKNILEKTTKFKVHNLGQDSILNEIKDMLSL